jgi:glucan 1,3-beta-glucosidase
VNSLKGINLGGWLVAERWMTPDLFANVQSDGEIALVRELGKEEAARRLEAHRGTFITKNDFYLIQQRGFKVVRLPVGYWLFEETPDFIDGKYI